MGLGGTSDSVLVSELIRQTQQADVERFDKVFSSDRSARRALDAQRRQPHAMNADELVAHYLKAGMSPEDLSIEPGKGKDHAELEARSPGAFPPPPGIKRPKA